VSAALTQGASHDALAALARRADPADAGAQNNLGVVLLARGQRDGAAAAFSRALALDPRMTLARRNLVAAGGDAWRARRVAELRARLRVDGGDAEARRELATVLADAGRLDEARRELDALCVLAPDDAGPCVQRALCEQRAGDLDAAVEWLTRAIERDPRAALPRAHLGEVLYHRGEPTRALVALDEALALAPEHADALYVRGFVLGELGRSADAEASHARALALNPALGRAHANLAAGAAPPPNETAASTAPAASPADAHHALGVAFRQKGYFDEAVREYRRALARDEGDVAVLRALGELHLLRGAPDDAWTPWARLTESCPADPSAWHGRAVAAHLGGRLGDAEAHYRQGLLVAPATGAERSRLANDLGVLLAARGSATAACEVVGDAVAADPTSRAVRLNHAQLLAATGNGEGAIAAYRAVLRRAADDADAWAGLGTVLAAAGRATEARAALARAIDADPSRADVRYELGFLAAADGDHGAARREAEQAMAGASLVLRRPLALAIDLGPGAEHAAQGLGVALPAIESAPIAGFDVRPDALDALLGDVLAPAAETAASVPSDDASRAYAVAEECLQAGLHERASAAASAALARGAPRVAGLTLLADVFAAQGYHGEALERYQEAASLDAAAVDARLGELRMLRETGRRALACDAATSLLGTHGARADVLALAALALVDGDEPNAGRDALDRAVNALCDGGTATAWTDVASAWRALGARDAELDACRRAVALAPSRWPLRLCAARALAALDMRDEAEAELTALLRDHPPCADARLELAALRLAAHDHAGARRLLVDVIEADPLHVDALAALGASLLAESRPADARVAVARALRFDREHALALALDGELLAREGSLAGARARWRHVLHAEPVGEGADRARRALAEWTS